MFGKGIGQGFCKLQLGRGWSQFATTHPFSGLTQLKHEIRREALKITFHLLIKALGCDPLYNSARSASIMTFLAPDTRMDWAMRSTG